MRITNEKGEAEASPTSGASRNHLRVPSGYNGRACYALAVEPGRANASPIVPSLVPPSSYLAFIAPGGYFETSDPNGAVAQLGERRVRNAEVEGSIPFRSIGFFEKIAARTLLIGPCQ